MSVGEIIEMNNKIEEIAKEESIKIKKARALGLRKKTARTSPEQQRKTQRNRSKFGRPGSVMYLRGQKENRQNAKIFP